MQIKKLITIFRKPGSKVPPEMRSNFTHLYFDIFWYGILNGSTIAFLSIFAARLGSSTQQIGLINALPAVITMVLALPMGAWLQNQVLHRTIFGAAVLNRIFYLPLILMPFFLSPSAQIWGIILIVFLMSIPGTGISVGFTALFAEAVPEEWRGYVSGIRNAVFAIATTVTSFACGFILSHFPFPSGYQIVFALGFLGAGLSTLHLWFVRPLGTSEEKSEAVDKVEQGISIRARIQTKILKTPFLSILLVLWSFHLAQYLPIPIFPVFSVKDLNLSDQTISLGTAFFYICTFLVSTQLDFLTRKLGSKKVTGYGVILMATYPGFMAIAKGETLYLIASLFGGAAWGMAGGAIYNYLLENVPANNRPAYLAWYNMGANAAILIGSMLGPIIAGWTGMAIALGVFAVFRLAAGFAILRWG